MSKARLKLSGPHDLVHAVPYLFGYTPECSVVVLGLSGDRGNLRTSMRVDIPPARELPTFCRQLATWMMRDIPDNAVVVIYPDPLAAGVAELRDALVDMLTDCHVGVLDVLVVSDGQWQSLECTNVHCCPPHPQPLADNLDSLSADALAATLGMSGPPAPSRDTLVTQLSEPVGDAATAMYTLLATLHAQFDLHCTPAGQPRTKLTPEQVTKGLEQFHAGVTLLTPGPHSGDITDDDIGWLLWALTDVSFRDELISISINQDLPSDAFWTELTKRSVGFWGAPPATALAVVAWKAGSGTRARIAVERALGADATYSLALLVEHALDLAMPPHLMDWSTLLAG